MYTAELSVSTSRRTQFLSITERINALIRKQGWRDGILTLFVPHTTAGITINENADPDVVRDMELFSNRLIPQSPDFLHGEGNSDSHIKSSFYGTSLQVIVKNGGMWLGTWQGIYFCEFDGPRERSLYLAFS